MHVDLVIHGRVQGVWFRETARREAEALGLRGFARNDAHGTVSIEVEGPADALAQFEKWCHRGPTLAHVTKVERAEGSEKGYEGFVVRR